MPVSDWIGCDGAILSDELIQAQLEAAIADERYEHAAKCRDELKRRRAKKQKPLIL